MPILWRPWKNFWLLSSSRIRKRVRSTSGGSFVKAGGQVFQNAQDFDEFMQLCELYGNLFTYTLIDFRSLRRITLKRVLTATTLLAAMALDWIFKPKIYDDL